MTPPEPSTLSLEALELPAVLALVAELAASDVGRARIRALAPAMTAGELAVRRRRQEQASLLLVEGALVPALEEPLAPALERLASPLDASPSDLLLVADLLATTGEAARRLAAGAQAAPELARQARALPPLDELRRRIGRSLDRRGRVRDDASPVLARLRGRVLEVRESLHRDLAGTLARHRELLAEETVPLHEGRLVLLVKAGARGQLRGLVHGRSGSGQSLYFEPLEIVEGNNRLAETIAEEEEERARILAELVAAAREALPALTAHLDFLAGLDLLQAAHRFGERAHGRLAEAAEDGVLALVGARHPLLDPALAPLRERALGTAGHTGAVVPLDLELGGERRVLVLTGPNAGGKTVALKCAGLLALMAQCGLPVPAAAGTRLPLLARVVAAVGDEQDLLADRSTFSGRLLRLAEAWEAAGPGSLALLDELGSGTDPEEGAALAVALLERLLAGGGLALITTHLTRLAAAALELPGAACGAMEFDPATGAPTYRLLPGAPGASEALALARRLGLAGEWIRRAEGLLDPQHRELRRLLAEVESTRRALVSKMAEVEQLDAMIAEQAAAVEQEREALESERRSLGARMRRELEAFRVEVGRRLAAEEARLKEAVAAGRRKGLVAGAVTRLFAELPEALRQPPAAAAREPREGERVRHRGLGWEGRLERRGDGRAEVLVGGKRVRCALAELVPIAEEAGGPPRARPRGADLAAEGPAELRLIGQRVEPALDALDRFLDRALLGPRREVRVVHGHGSGRLRLAVREHLAGHPAVASFRPGAPEEGGDGATVVALRER